MILAPLSIGILGAVILVIGSAYPIESVQQPTQSVKNWLFAIGGLCMLIYSTLNFLNGGSVFFVILQVLVNTSSILMMTDTPERISTPLVLSSGIVLGLWSMTLFEDFNTLFFIAGLAGISLGYTMKSGSYRRNLTLMLGSLLLALFSFIESDWIFFWLNVFFAMFSGYYTYRLRSS